MGDDRQEILIFEVGQQRFGLPTEIVQEIVRAVTIVTLPRTLEGFEGVVNFRGHVVPVVNFRQRLGFPVKAVELSDHLILIRFQSSLLALRVDRVVELLALRTTNALADTDDSGESQCLDRVADLGGSLVPIVDIQSLFAPGERDLIGGWLHGVASPNALDLRS